MNTKGQFKMRQLNRSNESSAAVRFTPSGKVSK